MSILISKRNKKYQLESLEIYSLINDENLKNNNIFNIIIMPMWIFNILELHDNFKQTNSSITDLKNLHKVGTLENYDCYVDFLLIDELILSCDEAVLRNIKIDIILTNSDIKSKSSIKVCLQ